MRVGFFALDSPYSRAALRHLAAAIRGKSRGWDISMVLSGIPRQSLLRGTTWVRHTPPPSARSDVEPPHCLESLAHASGLPLLRTSNANGARARSAVAEADLDYFVAVGFDRKFGPRLMALPRMGCLNVHPSPLPKLRGPAPVYWALREGAPELHVSVHKLEPEFDTGAVYAQRPIPTPDNATGAEIFARLGDVAGQLVAQSLDAAASGRLEGAPQDASCATQARLPSDEDAFVDPRRWTCRELLRFVSGGAIYRPAWTSYGSELLRLARGVAAYEGHSLGRDRAFERVSSSTARVQCADGVADLDLV